MAPSLSKGSSDVTSLVDGYNQSIITFEGSKFLANGHMFLSDVPDNIAVTPSPYSSTEKSISTVGSFVGFDTIEPNSCHVVPVGKLKNIRFMSISGCEDRWKTHCVGSNGTDLESETQVVILDKSDSGRPYVLLLPLTEGPFQASLQPGNEDNVDICVQSGSIKVSRASFRSVLYVHAGDDPFDLLKEAKEIIISEFDKAQSRNEEKKKKGLKEKLKCFMHKIKVNPAAIFTAFTSIIELSGCNPFECF